MIVLTIFLIYVAVCLVISTLGLFFTLLPYLLLGLAIVGIIWLGVELFK